MWPSSVVAVFTVWASLLSLLLLLLLLPPGTQAQSFDSDGMEDFYESGRMFPYFRNWYYPNYYQQQPQQKQQRQQPQPQPQPTQPPRQQPQQQDQQLRQAVKALLERLQTLEENVKTGAEGGCESGVIGPFSSSQSSGQIRFRSRFASPPAVSLALSDLVVSNTTAGVAFQIRPGSITNTEATVRVRDGINNIISAYVSYFACPNNANKPATNGDDS